MAILILRVLPLQVILVHQDHLRAATLLLRALRQEHTMHPLGPHQEGIAPLLGLLLLHRIALVDLQQRRHALLILATNLVRQLADMPRLVRPVTLYSSNLY